MINFDSFIVYISNLSYLAVFLLIIASGIGIPFPEDLVLLLSGYLSYLGIFKLEIAIPVCILGLIAADNLGYFLGNIPFVKTHYELIIILIVLASIVPVALHFLKDFKISR